MASHLSQPTSRVFHQVPRTTKMITTHSSILAIHPWTNSTRLGNRCRPIYTTKVAQPSSNLVGNSNDVREEKKDIKIIKEELYQAVQGINRGIFGVPSAKKSQIHVLVEMLESQNPTPEPTLNLDKVGGCWKLVYSTITILGPKRTKLGLRDFVTFGDFFQLIDVAKGKAVNVIKFNVRGLNLLNGQLTIEASFDVASKSRVGIKFENSTITPEQLLNVFRKNYDLLLGIFNPEGWLEITYVDDNLRIGRDNNGDIFILERSEVKN